MLVCLICITHAAELRAENLQYFAPIFTKPDIVGYAFGSENYFPNTNEKRGKKAVRAIKLSLGGVGHDLKSIANLPIREPKKTALALIGIGALIAVDKHTTTFWKQKIEPVFEDFTPKPLWDSKFLSAESQFLLAGIGGTYALGLIFNDEKAQTAALLSSKAITYSYLTTHLILKTAFGRKRPHPKLGNFTGDPGDYTTNPFDFGNRNGVQFKSVTYGTSMPSFHFTQYFAVARVYSEVYDNYLLPYAAAGLLSVSNIKGHNHWVSDMAAGALIGTAIGNIVLRGYEDRKREMMFAPFFTGDSTGFAFSTGF
jgi:membrane-associated phospholipid phosphatase